MDHQLNTTNIRALLAKGKLEAALAQMLDVSREEALPFSTEIHLIASRFQSLKNDRLTRSISREDYTVEHNNIVRSLLHQMDEWDRTVTHSSMDYSQCLEQLLVDYDQSEGIKSRASRMRTKNHLSRKIGELLITAPELFDIQRARREKALACGYCAKVRLCPAFGDLDVLAQLASPALGSFTKGSLVNALAELIYNGKLGIGEDSTVKSILDRLREQADLPLEKNIDRVQAALDFVLGIDCPTPPPPTPNTVDAEAFAYDGHIYNILSEVNRQLAGDFSLPVFLETLDRLFDRMTFRGEPDIATCRSQSWSQRIHSALMTHRAFLTLQRIFFPLASKSQRQQYQALLLSVSQYIDSMIAYLFEKHTVTESEIRDLIGKGEFVSRFKANQERKFPAESSSAGDNTTTLLDMPTGERKEINRYLAKALEAMEQLQSS